MTLLHRTDIADVKPGNILWSDGLRILVGELHDGYPRHTDGHPMPTYSFHGTILNLADVTDDGGHIVWPYTGLIDPTNPTWTVQGRAGLVHRDVEATAIRHEVVGYDSGRIVATYDDLDAVNAAYDADRRRGSYSRLGNTFVRTVVETATLTAPHPA